MKDFLETFDIDLWDIVESGYNPASRTKDGIILLKCRSSWTKDEKKDIFWPLKKNGLYPIL